MDETGGLPKLSDVAKRAGTSTATVSRCLNFPDKVSEKTRDKVMEAVKALGYTPNFAARAMAAKRTNTIGAIIPTMENAIFARGLQAFEEELMTHGFTMLVASSSYDTDLEERQIRTLIARGADALLLIGHDRSDATKAYLASQSVPTLVTWAFDPDNPIASVGFDNRKSMRELAREVIGMGHRDLAYISADTTVNDRARGRLDGVLDAMRDAGLESQVLDVYETVYSIEAGAAAFRDLFEKGAKPTAVLCGNDVLAVGAIQAAREIGLRVPQDVSITGFDDIEIGQVAYPPLTTVHVPHREMGRLAAQKLVAMVKDGTVFESQELQTKLRLRGSLASPPR